MLHCLDYHSVYLLTISTLKDIWIASEIQKLWIKFLKTSMCGSLRGHMFLTSLVESIPNQPCGICMCILFTYSICLICTKPWVWSLLLQGTNKTKTNKSLGLLLLLSFYLKYIQLFVIFSCISWSHSVAPSWPKAHHLPASASQMHRPLNLQSCVTTPGHTCYWL